MATCKHCEQQIVWGMCGGFAPMQPAEWIPNTPGRPPHVYYWLEERREGDESKGARAAHRLPEVFAPMAAEHGVQLYVKHMEYCQKDPWWTPDYNARTVPPVPEGVPV